MIKRSLLFVAVLLCVAFSVQAQEITTAVGNGADTYLSNDSQERSGYDFTADGTHGGEPSIKMRNLEGVRMKLGYVRFDISQLSDAQEFALALNVIWFKGVTSKFHIYALVNESLDNWDEMTISYNTAPGFVPTTEGIPVGYYDITEDLVKVTEMAYLKDFKGWIYSTPSAAMNDFINNDTNGLITFALIPDSEPDGDWDVSTKEDSVIYAPKLMVLETVTTADGNGADTYLSNDEQSAPRFHADSTHGGEASMKLRHLEGVRMKIAYMRFDISAVKSPETQIEGASIGLWPLAYKGTGFPVLSIYALKNEDLDDWDEMTTCYNNAPGFVPTTEGIPVGYYDFTGDLVKVDSMVMDRELICPGSDWREGIAFFYSTPSAEMDSIINNDTNGLLTFAILGTEGQDHDFDLASKEDTVTHVPKLVFNTVSITAIEDVNQSIITEYKLNQNYPNPFNPVTNIEFTLANPGHTILEIYNTLGQLVETLVDQQMSRGNHLISFRADNYKSGVYFYKLRSGDFTEVKKMMFLK